MTDQTKTPFALKACPCGKTYVSCEQQGSGFYAVQCLCGWTGPHYKTKELSIAAWNTRADIPVNTDGKFIMVPIEPTEEMITRGWAAWNNYKTFSQAVHDVYKAMIAARPAAPDLVSQNTEYPRDKNSCSPETRCNAAAPVTDDAWQPIETAPRDGTRILGTCEGAVFEMLWMPCYSNNEIPGWTDNFEHLNEYEPTHWMPLPPSPKALQPHKEQT